MAKVFGPLFSVYATGSFAGAITYKAHLSNFYITKKNCYKYTCSEKQKIQRDLFKQKIHDFKNIDKKDKLFIPDNLFLSIK